MAVPPLPEPPYLQTFRISYDVDPVIKAPERSGSSFAWDATFAKTWNINIPRIEVFF